jgi:hypothetical protein
MMQNWKIITKHIVKFYKKLQKTLKKYHINGLIENSGKTNENYIGYCQIINW